MEATGNFEYDLSFGIAQIVNELTRIADALEDFVYDDDENDEKHDPSDGPFVAQEPEETDGFADCPENCGE